MCNKKPKYVIRACACNMFLRFEEGHTDGSRDKIIEELNRESKEAGIIYDITIYQIAPGGD